MRALKSVVNRRVQQKRGFASCQRLCVLFIGILTWHEYEKSDRWAKRSWDQSKNHVNQDASQLSEGKTVWREMTDRLQACHILGGWNKVNVMNKGQSWDWCWDMMRKQRSDSSRHRSCRSSAVADDVMMCSIQTGRTCPRVSLRNRAVLRWTSITSNKTVALEEFCKVSDHMLG